MENKLKVGQSARVWEVVKPVELYERTFKVSSQYIENSILSYPDQPYLVPFNGIRFGAALTYSHEVKLIGKLTITKVK